MKKIFIIGILLGQLFWCHQIFAQETPNNSEKIELLKQKKEDLISEEKEALKREVIEINKRLDNEEITVQEADELKLEVADKHALNIKNKPQLHRFHLHYPHHHDDFQLVYYHLNNS